MSGYKIKMVNLTKKCHSLQTNHSTVKKSHRTLRATCNLEDSQRYATNSLYLNGMAAKPETTVLLVHIKNKGQTQIHHKHWGQRLTMNKKQQPTTALKGQQPMPHGGVSLAQIQHGMIRISKFRDFWAIQFLDRSFWFRIHPDQDIPVCFNATLRSRHKEIHQ